MPSDHPIPAGAMKAAEAVRGEMRLACNDCAGTTKELAAIIAREARLAELLAQVEKLEAAIHPVVAEAKERADYMHESWNADAHIELTLSVGELRTLHKLIGEATLAEPGEKA